MQPEQKERMKVAETATDAILKPQGFHKTKLCWRRSIGQTLQQFSIVSMQADARYRPEWGLNLLTRCEDPKPLPWKLQVQWILEMTVKNLEERLEYLYSFDFGRKLGTEQRQERITRLLELYVLPCFESFTTEEKVREMMGDRKFPLRAQSYVRLPDTWWPGGARASSTGSAPPPVIRPFKPK